MLIKVFLLMILCHIIDDFVLQPVCLSKLKQKIWWEQNAPEELYKEDYKIALFIHALSWSIMVHLPIMFFWNVPGIMILFMVGVNCLLHAYIDDQKANEKKISLTTDQVSHLLQIVGSFLVLCPFS